MTEPPAHANGHTQDRAQRLNVLLAAARTDVSRDDAIAGVIEYGSQTGYTVDREEAAYVVGAKAAQEAERQRQKELFPDTEPDVATPQASPNGHGRASAADWPEPAAAPARHGLVGEVLRLMDPHTEADPHAILITLLVALGNIVGRGPGFQAEGDFHATNLNALIVGRTAKGRKGTSWGRVRRLLELVEPAYVYDRTVSGLSSGEGLIWQVRDPLVVRRKHKKGDEQMPDAEGYIEETTDEGADDKRLLVIEGEFAQALKVMRREGNTLSVTIRNLWDHGRQGALTKNSPTRCSDALVSIAGHITVDELRREIAETDVANGFANRILFCCARRSKILPDGADLDEAKLTVVIEVLRSALAFTRHIEGPLYRDEQARELWHERYEKLSEGRLGMLGAVTSRAEAQVMRLAVIYAVLDESMQIRLEHLQAALAVWEYCERSAAFIFGNAIGDPTADEILNALRTKGDAGMARNEIRDLFSRHKTAAAIGTALNVLLEHGLVRFEQVATGGRPSERWYGVRGKGLHDGGA